MKNLCLALEQCLFGAYMATSVIQKANARLKFLYRKRGFLNLTTNKLLVMSLIQCHFDFACSLWYPGLSKILKNNLQVTQNQIIWFVLNMDSRAHVGSDVFKSLGWLPVSKRVTNAYKLQPSLSERVIVDGHGCHTALHFGVKAKENQDKVTTLYWLPKLHKRPYKARFIANSSSCTTTELSKLFTSCLTAVKKHVIKYCEKVYERSGIY